MWFLDLRMGSVSYISVLEGPNLPSSNLERDRKCDRADIYTLNRAILHKKCSNILRGRLHELFVSCSCFIDFIRKHFKHSASRNKKPDKAKGHNSLLLVKIFWSRNVNSLDSRGTHLGAFLIDRCSTQYFQRQGQQASGYLVHKGCSSTEAMWILHQLFFPNLSQYSETVIYWTKAENTPYVVV